MYQVVLFDLEGTLTDPGLGITNSVMYALKKWGIEVSERSELYKFIGPPLKESFERFYGFSEEKAEKTVEYYREYFREKGLYENEVYEGIKELLERLNASGHKVILATSKPEEFAIKILEHFDLAKYFSYIGGASMDGVRSKKSDVIHYALEKADINELSEAVMVGDREHDILGAKQVGIDSIGVLFGYGDYEELENAGATYIVDSVAKISDVIYGSHVKK